MTPLRPNPNPSPNASTSFPAEIPSRKDSFPLCPVSVVVITHGRRNLLQSCLQSLEACAPPRPREIVVVLNGRDPETRRWLVEFAPRRAIRWFETTRSSKGRARNFGARVALGDYVYFLDDDVTAVPSLFQCLSAKFRAHPGVKVFGGPNRTPPDSTSFQKSVGFILESWWGAGRMRARYSPAGEDHLVDDRSLMLCNLVVQRSLFQDGNTGFPEDFFYNEENFLLETYRRRGVRMVYCPSLSVYHARRGDGRGFLEQVWRSGVGRGHMTRWSLRSLRVDFLGPPLFLVYLLSLPFLRNVWVLGPLGLYALLTLGQSLKYYFYVERHLLSAIRVAFLIPGGHIMYGIGFYGGIFRKNLNSPKPPSAAGKARR